jgi:hypothetical protein
MFVVLMLSQSHGSRNGTSSCNGITTRVIVSMRVVCALRVDVLGHTSSDSTRVHGGMSLLMFSVFVPSESGGPANSSGVPACAVRQAGCSARACAGSAVARSMGRICLLSTASLYRVVRMGVLRGRDTLVDVRIKEVGGQRGVWSTTNSGASWSSVVGG